MHVLPFRLASIVVLAIVFAASSTAQAAGARARGKRKITSTKTWKGQFNRVFRGRVVKAGRAFRQKLATSSRVIHRDGKDTVLVASSKNGQVHLQVVPHERSREHVARRMGGLIRRGDVETVLGHMARAESLAKTLGVKDAKIWIQPEGKTAIGQLRIHIQGSWSKADIAPLRAESKVLSPYMTRHRARMAAIKKVGLEKIGAIFEGIAVRRQWQGQHVLMDSPKALAFIDRTDAAHPAYHIDNYVDVGARHISPERLSHILVIPKVSRQHITRKLGEPIRKADLHAALQLIKTAETLGKTLKISKPDVWINAESRIGVGYLHAHIAGIKTRETVYPKALLP